MPKSGTPSVREWLQYLHDIGIADALGDKTCNRYQVPFQKHQEKSEPVQDLSSKHPENPEKLQAMKTAKSDIQLLKDELKSFTTLESLRQKLECFETCPLKSTAMNTVFGDGNPHARVMLVGEAPGADEDRQGKPFVGMSGQLLGKMFEAIGLVRDQLYISNIIPWRPPGNRQPTTTETSLCLPFIQRHIEIINPDILVMVGGVSAKTLLQRNEGIMKIRGQWLDYQTENMKKPIKAFPIYHPAYLLRSPGQKRKSWHDLLKIKAFLDTQ